MNVKIEETVNPVAVPRRKVNYTHQDPLSKKLRTLDNLTIKTPFPNQSGIYINTNERGIDKNSRALGLFPTILEPIHIGFSGWHNFDIIAQRLSSRAVICDINPENALFLSYVLKALTRCKDRFTFVTNVTHYIKKYKYEGSRTIESRESYLDPIRPKSLKFSLNVCGIYPYTEEEGHFSVVDEVALELKRKTSWLYTDARYAYLRHLALHDKIALITESISKTSTFSTLCTLLKENMMQIDTLYISNIAEWMMNPRDREQFIKTVKLFLSTKETILLDAVLGDDKVPNQRCASASDLMKIGLEKWLFPRYCFGEEQTEEITLKGTLK